MVNKLSAELENAVREDDEDKLIRLLSLDSTQINFTDSAGTPLLHFAVMSGSRRFVSFLLSRGASVDARDSAGMAALHHAAKDGRLEFIVELARQGADLELAASEGMTPLMWASISRSGKADEAADLLVRLGAKMTAFPAVFLNRVDDVRATLSHGLDPASRRWYDEMLRAAEVYSNQEIIDLLRKHRISKTSFD